MTLKQLETFYWVFRLGSFVAAAERLHSTQSAVSMRIQDLEASLGVALFDRKHRSVQLTAKGQELLRYVERLLSLTAEIRHRVCDPEVIAGNIRLGVTELVAVTWLADLVRAINQRYPRVTVELNVDVTLNQIRKLQCGELDLALLPGPITEPGLSNVSVGSLAFAWMASPLLDVPSRRLTPRDLDEWPLLTPAYQSHLHKVLGSWFDRSDATQHRVNVCNSIGILAALTKAGLGIAYLPVSHMADEIATGQLKVLKTTPRLPDLEYFAIYQKRNTQPLAPVIAELAQQLSCFDKPAREA
ncbi:MAG: LysR family transcriptional regulator [Hyphomicrobiaceae bacterium]|nr:LysR family transcriptional regulator [Hyphomicrobiaceae bacterium]